MSIGVPQGELIEAIAAWSPAGNSHRLALLILTFSTESYAGLAAWPPAGNADIDNEFKYSRGHGGDLLLCLAEGRR